MSVPAENRVWCKQCADFFEHSPSQDLAFDRQSSPLIVMEQDPFLPNLFLEHLILGAEVESITNCCCRLTQPARMRM